MSLLSFSSCMSHFLAKWAGGIKKTRPLFHCFIINANMDVMTNVHLPNCITTDHQTFLCIQYLYY